MKISDLWGKFENDTLYIVGTGPSVRYFDFSFLVGKFSLGLNLAYKLPGFQPTWSITIHPELIPTSPQPLLEKGRWLTKIKGKSFPGSPIEKASYIFQNNHDVKDFSYCKNDWSQKLYVGRGIHTGALCFAAKAGFKTAVLIGCDFSEANGVHHGLDQHTQFHGLTPTQVYNEYYQNLVKLRSELFALYGLQILSLSPILGESQYIDENAALQLLHQKPEPILQQQADISSYNRQSVDF